MLRPFHVYGGVLINATEGVVLSDLLGIAANQNLISQTIADTASLFITLDTKCKYFFLEQVTIGYVDGANVNDLAKVYLIENPEADDILQLSKARWSDVDGVVETPTGPTIVTADKAFMLGESGKLYFQTEWTTAVIDCGAAEWFFLRVDGYTFNRN